MYLQYRFTQRCFFDGAIREKGQETVLEESIGDSFPWLERCVMDEAVKRMQSPVEGACGTSMEEGKAKAPRRKGAKAVPTGNDGVQEV